MGSSIPPTASPSPTHRTAAFTNGLIICSYGSPRQRLQSTVVVVGASLNRLLSSMCHRRKMAAVHSPHTAPDLSASLPRLPNKLVRTICRSSLTEMVESSRSSRHRNTPCRRACFRPMADEWRSLTSRFRTANKSYWTRQVLGSNHGSCVLLRSSACLLLRSSACLLLRSNARR